MKKVTIVIPNWNGMKFLKACLDSLKAQDTDDFYVLMIDNASEDESVEFVHTHYPFVEVRVMEKNLGFSGGVNEGIKATKTPYVLLLNNDTEADHHFVSGMIEAIESDPKIFSVSARMISYKDRTKLDDCGDLYTIMGWQIQRGIDHEVTDTRYLKEKKVFSACAGAAMYRRAVFDEIGLFDLDHFAYLEDIDVGYRGLIYGYKNIYTPKGIVYHVGSGASGAVKYSDFKVRISARNSIYLAYKNMPLIQRGINTPFLWLGRKLKKSFFVKEGFGEAYEAGIREGKEKRKNTKKVPFKCRHFFNYVRIEGLLIKNMFIYVKEYIERHGK